MRQELDTFNRRTFYGPNLIDISRVCFNKHELTAALNRGWKLKMIENALRYYYQLPESHWDHCFVAIEENSVCLSTISKF